MDATNPPTRGANAGAARCLAAIDDAGDYLIVAGSEFSLGHGGKGEPDIGFLGDLDPIHARIRLVESFHGGFKWVLQVGDEAPRKLHHEDRIRLGASAEFRFDQRNPASASAVLELGRNTDAVGARRVMLLAPGPSGIVSIGARLSSHIPVAGLKSNILISYQGVAQPTLTFACDGGVRLQSDLADGAVGAEVALPLKGRTNLSFGAAPDRLPPYSISLRPVGH